MSLARQASNPTLQPTADRQEDELSCRDRKLRLVIELVIVRRYQFVKEI